MDRFQFPWMVTDSTVRITETRGGLIRKVLKTKGSNKRWEKTELSGRENLRVQAKHESATQ